MMNRGGVFKIHDEPESPNERGCLRHINIGQMRGAGVFINREGGLYDEPESPNEGAWIKSVMNRNRQMRGRVSDI